MLNHSLSPIVSMPFTLEGISIDGDNIVEEYRSGREQGYDDIHDDLEI